MNLHQEPICRTVALMVLSLPTLIPSLAYAVPLQDTLRFTESKHHEKPLRKIKQQQLNGTLELCTLHQIAKLHNQ